MNITPEQLQMRKSELLLCSAEIDLQEKELETWKRRGEAERNLYAFIVDVSADPAVSRKPLNAYCLAQKAHYAAQGELKQIAIVKLKSQKAILEYFIAEAEKIVAEPGRGLITQ